MMDLSQSLHTVRRRWQTLQALLLSARALVAVALIAALAAVTERWLQPSDGAVLALALLAFASALAALALFAWPLRTRPDDRQLARFVEEHCPELDDAIVTAVELQQRGSSESAFAPLVLQSAAARLGAVDFAGCVSPRDLRTAGWTTAAAAAAFVLAFMLAVPFVERASQVAYLLPVPGSIGVPSARATCASRPAAW